MNFQFLLNVQRGEITNMTPYYVTEMVYLKNCLDIYDRKMSSGILLWNFSSNTKEVRKRYVLDTNVLVSVLKSAVKMNCCKVLLPSI